MFDNFLNKLKNQANTITSNIKAQSLKLTNLDTYKNPFKSKNGNYDSINQGEELSYLSPRAYSDNDTKWPSIINDNNMEWLPYVPYGEDNSIVDRFVRVITLNDDITSIDVCI